jgi:hypothetical protein
VVLVVQQRQLGQLAQVAHSILPQVLLAQMQVVAALRMQEALR